MESTRAVSAGQASTLADIVERVLDKGLVINADIAVSVAGVELLGIKIRAAIASFETAARWGLEFPSGTSLVAPAWGNALPAGQACPRCRKRLTGGQLLGEGCSACGWLGPKRALQAR